MFLDELGELSPSIQAKLLRAIQEREINRIGGTRPIPIDIRLIAATNRDLEAAVERNEFRQDLLYRLKVITIKSPALRDRRSERETAEVLRSCAGGRDPRSASALVVRHAAQLETELSRQLRELRQLICEI